MCYVAAIPLVMMAASTVMSAVNSYQDAKAQNKTLEYNRQVELQNAAMSRQEASYARAQAQRNANEKRKETLALIGAQRAKMGASGALVDSGSFLDLTLSTREEGEKDAVGLLQQGDVQAWRHDVQAGRFEDQARIYQASKKNPGSILAGSLLSGAAKMGESYFSSGLAGGLTGGATTSADFAKQAGIGDFGSMEWFNRHISNQLNNIDNMIGMPSIR